MEIRQRRLEQNEFKVWDRKEWSLRARQNVNLSCFCDEHFVRWTTFLHVTDESYHKTGSYFFAKNLKFNFLQVPHGRTCSSRACLDYLSLR